MRSKQQSVAFILLSFVVIWVSAGCRSQAGTLAGAPQERRAGARIKAPNFELTDLNGKKVSLESLKGKAVFLDFWATWCPPCIQSSPEVEKLAQDYDPKNVAVISVSLDDDAETVKAFVERRHLKNRVLMAGSTGVDVHYHVSGIPAFFIIDQEGYFVARWQGYSPVMARAWRSELDSLVKS